VVKPFLLLAIRAEDAAADNEYESFLAFAGLGEKDLHRVRLERGPLGPVDLRDWSGIFLGGGPFNSSDPEKSKPAVQRRVEADLRGLLDRVITADFAFLGTCYGIGALGGHQGALVDRRHAEPVGPVTVTLTPEGRRDPLLRGLPATFDAFTGHKEAISRLPPHAVLLARSATCPVQAFRIGSHVYATQFHPELDAAGLAARIDVYKHAGYFDPGEADQLKALARRSHVVHPAAILRHFVQRYADP
jgi:GMP synthase (glutamine-hydrolysing)